jgi:hypothetical protein
MRFPMWSRSRHPDKIRGHSRFLSFAVAGGDTLLGTGDLGGLPGRQVTKIGGVNTLSNRSDSGKRCFPGFNVVDPVANRRVPGKAKFDVGRPLALLAPVLESRLFDGEPVSQLRAL